MDDRDRSDGDDAPNITGDKAPPAPTWVKVAGAIALILVLVVVIALLSGGKHGPGRHQSTVHVASQAPIAEGHERA